MRRSLPSWGRDFKRKMLDYFNDKYVLPMVVRGESPDLVADIRRIVGATNPANADKGTIRGDLGCDSYEKCNRENRSCQNLIHASDSAENARIETALWFGGRSGGAVLLRPGVRLDFGGRIDYTIGGETDQIL